MGHWVFALFDSNWQFGILWLIFQIGRSFLSKKNLVIFAFALLNAGFILFVLNLGIIESLVSSIVEKPLKITSTYLWPLFYNKLSISIIMVIGCTHLGFLVWQIIKLINGALELSNLQKNSSVIDRWGVGEISKKIAQSLYLEKEFRILFSDSISSPSMAGHFKPFLLLPLPLINELTLDQLKLLLIHEYAHLLHKDYLMHLWIRVLSCIFYFNPFFKKLALALEFEMECRSDEQVTKMTNQSHQYIELLAVLARKEKHQLALTKSLTGNGGAALLLRRVQRMLGQNMTDETSFSAKKSFPVFIIFAFSIFMHNADVQISPEKEEVKKDIALISLPTESIVKTEAPKYKTVLLRTQKKQNKVTESNLVGKHKSDDIAKRLTSSLKDIHQDLIAIQWVIENPFRSEELQKSFTSISTDSIPSQLPPISQFVEMVATSLQQDSLLLAGLDILNEKSSKDTVDEISLRLLNFRYSLEKIQESITSLENLNGAEEDLESMKVRLSNLSALLEHHKTAMEFWLHLSLKMKNHIKTKVNNKIVVL